MTTTIPHHHDMPHLRPLSYFLIAGFQPRGRTELLRRPEPSPMIQAASAVIRAAMKAHKQKDVHQAVYGSANA